MMSELRTKDFVKNDDLESFLKEINGVLEKGENELINRNFIKYPILFIVGPLRSGTTLMLQWLANSGNFCYPTNLISRFYSAPIIGAKLQRLLTDEKLNFRNELYDIKKEIDYVSENGKTKGALAPNEFWYFWRRFKPFNEVDYSSDDKLLEQFDFGLFNSELLGIANEFEKPLVLKALICNYNIELINMIMDNIIFIYTKREPSENIVSALEARMRQLNSKEKWYSFKIPEYEKLIKIKDPIRQVAGQIYYINKAIEKGLEKVSEERKIIVNYEDFCSNPEKVYFEIVEKIKKQGFEMDKNYTGPTNFNISRKIEDPKIYIDAYNSFID